MRVDFGELTLFQVNDGMPKRQHSEEVISPRPSGEDFVAKLKGKRRGNDRGMSSHFKRRENCHRKEWHT